MSKVPLTAEGAETLREELHDLKSERRPKVIQAIAEAREHGDLKENAEYHAAREQQSFIEGRIKEIESKLSHAQIIDITQMNDDGKVIFGTTVQLLDIEADSTVTYKIVGDDEANIKLGLISFSSPLARAIIGKREGDEVAFEAPAGTKEYEIEKVSYI